MAHKAKTWRRRGSHLYLRKERARQREQQIKRHAPGVVEEQQEGQYGGRALGEEEELFRQCCRLIESFVHHYSERGGAVRGF